MASSATLSTNGHGSKMENKALENVRQATPDSDVVVSSDEETTNNMTMSLHSAKSMPVAHRPVRRPSWLSEVHSTQRKYSIGATSVTSGASQPPTPSVENGPVSSNANKQTATMPPGLNPVSNLQTWDLDKNGNSSHLIRPSTGNSTASSSSFAWNSPLWQQTHQYQSHKSSSIHSARLSSSSIALDSSKANQNALYHSQSQLISPTNTTYEDLRSPTSLSNPAEHFPSPSLSGPGLPFDIPLEPNRKIIRSQSYSSGVKRSILGRHPSRPGLYTMDNHDGNSLHEVEEDESPVSTTWNNNSILASSSNMQESAINDIPEDNKLTRRTTAPAVGLIANNFFTPSSSNDSESSRPELVSMESYESLRDDQIAAGTQRAAEHAQSTLANAAALAQTSSSSSTAFQTHRTNNNNFNRNSSAIAYDRESPYHQLNLLGLGPNPHGRLDTGPHSPSNHRQVSANHQQNYEFSPSPPPHQSPTAPISTSRSLFLVSFKSSRSEIHYVPPGSDLNPQPGDMVVVEGDRGQDMGMVKFARLTLEEAKIHKAEYNRRHYKSLVTFSRMFPHVAAAASTEQMSASTDAVAASNLADPRGRKDPSGTNPKLIRRIATESEIRLLRDKEGNEAKAKRICQAKVIAHGIHMEILDAEFQLDYKKLTFYFYAEQYINFNDLVTELFKLWKTRIWLSAVNPASYPDAKSRGTSVMQSATLPGPARHLKASPHETVDELNRLPQRQQHMPVMQYQFYNNQIPAHPAMQTMNQGWYNSSGMGGNAQYGSSASATAGGPPGLGAQQSQAVASTTSLNMFAQAHAQAQAQAQPTQHQATSYFTGAITSAAATTNAASLLATAPAHSATQGSWANTQAAISGLSAPAPTNMSSNTTDTGQFTRYNYAAHALGSAPPPGLVGSMGSIGSVGSVGSASTSASASSPMIGMGLGARRSSNQNYPAHQFGGGIGASPSGATTVAPPTAIHSPAIGHVNPNGSGKVSGNGTNATAMAFKPFSSNGSSNSHHGFGTLNSSNRNMVFGDFGGLDSLSSRMGEMKTHDGSIGKKKTLG